MNIHFICPSAKNIREIDIQMHSHTDIHTDGQIKLGSICDEMRGLRLLQEATTWPADILGASTWPNVNMFIQIFFLQIR
jgi:hypothetical protein